MHVESDGGGDTSAVTRKMTGSVHQFKVAAAAGKVSIDPDSAEAMATKVDAIADRAESRLDYFRFLGRT